MIHEIIRRHGHEVDKYLNTVNSKVLKVLLNYNIDLFLFYHLAAEESNFILTTFERVMSLTGRCIIFTPRTTEKDYVYIAKAGGYVVSIKKTLVCLFNIYNGSYSSYQTSK